MQYLPNTIISVLAVFGMEKELYTLPPPTHTDTDTHTHTHTHTHTPFTITLLHTSIPHKKR
jgi:hypothetical protein